MPVSSLITVPAMELAALLALPWINIRRRRYRRRGTPLSAQERATLEPYFDSALLDSVRICRVPRIEPGLPPALIRLLRLPASVDISAMAGMAFTDSIVIAQRGTRSINEASLLFHELVHCMQYRALGTHGFLRQYLRGWAGAGFDYLSIPLEEQAYRLQDRFDSGDAFNVESEVSAELHSLKYL